MRIQRKKMDLSLKTQRSNRRFYNKWAYKITLKVPGSSIFRMYKIKDIPDLLDHDEKPYGYMRKAQLNKDVIVSLINYLDKKNILDIRKRIEADYIDFYTNDSSIYNDLSLNFQDILKHRFEPDSTVPLAAEDEEIIYVKKYPHNGYIYKVFLRPHKFNKDIEAKKKFLDWIDLQQDRIKISQTVKEWFIKTDWNWDRRYVWVKDEPTLLMLSMRSAEGVGKVYKHIIVDK